MLQYLKTLKLHIVPYSLLHKKCVIHIHILTMTYFHCWKFALWFFMQITRFLWVKEWNTNLFFSRANCSRCSLKKSNGAKSYGSKSGGSNLLVAIQMGKAVKNCQKTSWKQHIYLCELLVFWEQKSEFPILLILLNKKVA